MDIASGKMENCSRSTEMMHSATIVPVVDSAGSISCRFRAPSSIQQQDGGGFATWKGKSTEAAKSAPHFGENIDTTISKDETADGKVKEERRLQALQALGASRSQHVTNDMAPPWSFNSLESSVPAEGAIVGLKEPVPSLPAGGNHTLDSYQRQLMLLEEQRKKREGQEQESMSGLNPGSGGMMAAYQPRPAQGSQYGGDPSPILNDIQRGKHLTSGVRTVNRPDAY
jgi:hypothetical protein